MIRLISLVKLQEELLLSIALCVAPVSQASSWSSILQQIRPEDDFHGYLLRHGNPQLVPDLAVDTPNISASDRSLVTIPMRESLQDLCQREGVLVPRILTLCAEFIEIHGLDTEVSEATNKLISRVSIGSL